MADAHFFDDLLNTHTAEIHRLKISDIHNRGYIPLETFIQNTGIPISERKLIGLRGVYDTAVLKYAKANGSNLDKTEILTFINRFKKGSKSFKRLFATNKNVTISNNMVCYAEKH